MRDHQKSHVTCELPDAGLGNVLFPLMKAALLAHMNNLPMLTTGYHRLRIGPYLRREKTKRHYSKYFTFQKGIIGEFTDKLKLKGLRHRVIVEEPDVCKAVNISEGNIYRYNAIPHWTDFFKGLRENRLLAVRLFWELVRKDVKERVETLPPPVIGVHVRMGDYRSLREGENFKKVGHVRTPEMYFVDVIKAIRTAHGSELPVSIFTNGYRNEFGELLSLGHISFVEGNRDIEDLLLLSKSKVIVTSAGSTFGYWAGFLSEAPIILHPDHIHQPIRPIDSGLFEGPVNAYDDLFINSIRSVDFNKF